MILKMGVFYLMKLNILKINNFARDDRFNIIKVVKISLLDNEPKGSRNVLAILVSQPSRE